MAHYRQRPFAVKILDCEHPLARKMNDFQADDELYTCLAGERPTRLSAAARSKKTANDRPMAFTLNYGKGRVLHAPLRHDVKATETPGVAESSPSRMPLGSAAPAV